jgi:hypothetical protein
MTSALSVGSSVVKSMNSGMSLASGGRKILSRGVLITGANAHF